MEEKEKKPKKSKMGVPRIRVIVFTVVLVLIQVGLLVWAFLSTDTTTKVWVIMIVGIIVFGAVGLWIDSIRNDPIF